MIYKSWMQFIKNEAKLVDVVMPSAHNAYSFSQPEQYKTQDGDFYEQFTYGARHFEIKIDTDKEGNIVLCRGLKKGTSLESALQEFQRMIEESDEFFIFDIREYYLTKIVGNYACQYYADKDVVNGLLDKYLEPGKYAYCDFDDVNNVTVGDIRRSKKRYLLINYKKEYDYSVSTDVFIPWKGFFENLEEKNGNKNGVGFFDDYKLNSSFWFRTQKYPHPQQPVGNKTPRKEDRYYSNRQLMMIEGIANHKEYLNNARIISADFLTKSYYKSRFILMLNVLKGNVKECKEGEFLRGLWKGE